MHTRFTLKITDFLLLMIAASLCAWAWRIDQDNGWMTVVISICVMTYGLNHFRFRPRLLPTSLLILPFVAILLFGVAMLAGLHHPPFLAPPGWEWPPFTSIKERAMHAFALSLWTFIFGVPTVAACGVMRRVTMGASTPSQTTNRNENE